jgi:hypothetical protein
LPDWLLLSLIFDRPESAVNAVRDDDDAVWVIAGVFDQVPFGML